MITTPPNVLDRVEQEDSVASLGGGLPTTSAPTALLDQRLPLNQLLEAVDKRDEQMPQRNTWMCKIRLKISVFFDGTGNNLKADQATMEHSNVARMFRAHISTDEASDIYPIYVPGIGTLFPEIGDDGKGKFLGFIDTHNGMGAKGQDRLDFAFNQIATIVSESKQRCRQIVMISLSVFGFSRGATLARAFLRDLLDWRKGYGQAQGTELYWIRGAHPMEIRFVGIWDTVAAVGMPAGANGTAAFRSSLRDNLARGFGVAAIVIPGAKCDLSARTLAFGSPGADPAEGAFHGHDSWAEGLAIPDGWVSGRCVHMIAAHEQRNSFPLDSVLRGTQVPANTVEIAYPGVHSDVGGGYRPGEGGKGKAATAGSINLQQAILKPSQASLRAMYQEALAAGVPMRRMGNPKEWKIDNEDDFAISSELVELFNHYISQAQTGGLPLGDAMLKHMRLYFAWRFRKIFRIGRAEDEQKIEANEKIFAQDAKALKTRLQQLKSRRMKLVNEQSAEWPPTSPSTDQDQRQLDLEIKEVQAKIDTLPSIGTLGKRLKDCDDELLNDVRCITEEIAKFPKLREVLRPHYRNMVEAYEAECIHDNGLRDEKIIAFFDKHIHDSLADFDSDFTLPSDPRVIYVGGDSKLQYASLGVPRNAGEFTAPDGDVYRA